MKSQSEEVGLDIEGPISQQVFAFEGLAITPVLRMSTKNQFYKRSIESFHPTMLHKACVSLIVMCA